MHVGVFYPASEDGMRVDELARELEARGFESLFIPEHTHMPVGSESAFRGGRARMPKDYAKMMDPFIALSFAAAASRRLTLGTGICLLAQRDPIVTAKAVASLDALAGGGRLMLGIGGGWNVEEMNNHGVEYGTRFARLREHVLAMKALWTEEEASFHGDFVDFDPVWSYPKPATKPHPPVLLGGETEHTLRRVVGYCEGWFPRPTHGFEPEDGMRRLREAAEAAGRDPATISVTVFRLPQDRAEVARYAAAGIDRGLLQLSGEGRDAVLRKLDDFAPLLGA